MELQIAMILDLEENLKKEALKLSSPNLSTSHVFKFKVRRLLSPVENRRWFSLLMGATENTS